jgi:hypothetical protein
MTFKESRLPLKISITTAGKRLQKQLAQVWRMIKTLPKFIKFMSTKMDLDTMDNGEVVYDQV